MGTYLNACVSPHSPVEEAGEREVRPELSLAELALNTLLPCPAPGFSPGERVGKGGQGDVKILT